MRRFTFLGLFCLTVIASPACAQALLPSAFAGWTASAPSVVVPTAQLDQALGSGASVFREYFIKSLERRTYVQGSQPATVALYRFRDPSSAYGAYTYFRSDSLTPIRVGSFGSASPERALVVVGDFLIDVSSGVTSGAVAKEKRPSDASLKTLADSLDKLADHTSFPTIGEFLPVQGRVARSEHYILGPRALAQSVPIATDDWIGFDYSAEALAAHYQLSGKDATLLVASYPTQQIAADKFAAMLRRFVFDPPGGVPVEVPSNGAPNQNILFGKRAGSFVAVVIGAPSRQAANALLDRIGYQSQVTWDEPKHTLTDPSIGSIVVGVFVGTGIFMLLAMAVGVGFGGFRVLMKIFFPNKVFDREKQIEILQLGIYSKPIHAKDFYQKSEKTAEN